MFSFVLSHEIYDELVIQMNLYANQQRAIKGDTTTFVPLTKAELMVFINQDRGHIYASRK